MLNFLCRHPQKLKIPHLEKDLLKKHYQQLVAQGYIQTDLAQIEVLNALQQLLNKITQQPKQANFSHSKKATKSLYIFGDVGRGKSLLMALFFEACPIIQKRRVHFHTFMLEVHDFIYQWRKQQIGDPLAAFAKHLHRSTWLLCFDEFNVTDIADAMILMRLFNYLFAQGIILVATSNDHPDDLYKGGLQHALFLPFIARLKQTADILELVTQNDYRLSNTDPLNGTFHIGLGANADAFLAEELAHLTTHAKIQTGFLKVQQRDVYFKAMSGDILYSSFQELCHRTLGSADYIAISKYFKTVLIANIPQLSLECRDQAQRFVILIDALYEANVSLICTLEVSVDLLYKEDGVFEFRRTQSRLIEMQSAKYKQRQSLSKSS